MKDLLAKYGLHGALWSPDDAAATPPAPAPVAPAPAAAAPAAAEPVKTDPPAAAPPATILGGAVKTAAETAAADKATADAAAAAEAAKANEYKNDDSKTPEENAALKAKHDEKIAADKAKADEAAKPKDERTPEQIEAAAAAYEIKPPEGFTLSEAIEKPFRTFAAKHNLSQTDVKELSDLQLKLYADQAEEHARTVEQWGKDSRADKEIGGPAFDANAGKAAAFINEFFPPAAAALLDKTGIGNHPDFVKGFVRAGIAMGEIPSFRANAGAGGKESVQDILYPSTK